MSKGFNNDTYFSQPTIEAVEEAVDILAKNYTKENWLRAQIAFTGWKLNHIDMRSGLSPVEALEKMMKEYNNCPSEENYIMMVDAFMDWFRADGNIIIPIFNPSMEHVLPDNIKDLYENESCDAQPVETGTVLSEEGNLWLVGCTNYDEAAKVRKKDGVITTSLKSLYDCLLRSEEVKGIVINPWGYYLLLPRDILQIIFVDITKQPVC